MNIIEKLKKSINKNACENYLFEDYHWKSGKTTLIINLKSSGRTKRNFPFEIFRSRVIEKFGAFLQIIKETYI